MDCKNGHSNVEGVKFCGYCGLPMEPLATKDIGVEPELEGGDGDIESSASDEGSLGFNPDTGVPSAIEKRAAPGARRRVLVVCALIVVAIAGTAVFAANRSGSSASQHGDISPATDPKETTLPVPTTPQEFCEQTALSVWHDQFHNTKSITDADQDVLNTYGYQSAIYHAFHSMEDVLLSNMHQWGMDAGNRAAVDSVGDSCRQALASYALNEYQPSLSTTSTEVVCTLGCG